MKICCVPLCHKYNGRDKTRSFHEFPCQMDLREKWIKIVSRFDPETKGLWQPNDRSAVCSKHFLTTDFKEGAKHRRLNPDVVPTVFDHYPKYMQRAAQKFVQKRKPPMRRLPLPTNAEKKQKKAKKAQLTNGISDVTTISPPSRFSDASTQVTTTADTVECGVQVNSLPRLRPYSLEETRKKLRTSQRMNYRMRKQLEQLTERVEFLERKTELYKKYPVRKVVKSAKSGSVHAQFMLEQLQVYNKNRKQVRFSKKTMEFCHTWNQYCSSRSYEYVRRIGLLELPSHHTLLRHQSSIEAVKAETARQKKEESDALIDETIENVVRSSREEAESLEDIVPELLSETSEEAGTDLGEVLRNLVPGQVYYLASSTSDGSGAGSIILQNGTSASDNPTQAPVHLIPKLLQVFSNDHCYFVTPPTAPVPAQVPPDTQFLEQILTASPTNCTDFG